MAFFKNKKSVVLLFIALFWLIYTAASITMFVANLQTVFEQEKIRRENQINYQSDLAMSFLVQDQTEALKDNLAQALQLGQIDFAILLSKNAAPFTLARNGKVDLAESYEPTEGVVSYENLIFRTIRVKDYSLTLGTSHDRKVFLQSYFQVYAGKILFDILLITILSGLLIYFVLRDLIQLSKILRRNSPQKLQDFKAKSLETQVLTSATQSFDNLSKELAWEAQVFSSSLGAAITTELRRGTKSPTAFPAALVRVDLNQYTQKFLSTDLQDMIRVLNNYFKSAREIIERHHGLIYEYVGDEILFFFKDPKLSQDDLYRIAVLCVRDLFTEIEFLNLKNFTVKASISCGDLNFIKLDQGYSFTGVSLIQSARMLGQISNKNTNALILLQHDFSKIENLVSEKSDVSVPLKGFDGDFALTEITKFHAMNSHEPTPWHFRSTPDLIRAFVSLKEYLQAKNTEKSQILVSELSRIRVQQADSLLSEAYLQAFHLIVKDPFEQKILSGLVSLGQQYVTQDQYMAEMKPLLETVNKSSDPRVRANALLTRAHFESDIDLDVATLRSSNRYMADALFVLGRVSVDKKILQQIDWMIHHSERNYQASAFYLCSALLKYHRDNDPVYFNANPLFEKLKEFLRLSLKKSDSDLHKHALNYQSLTGEKL